MMELPIAGQFVVSSSLRSRIRFQNLGNSISEKDFHFRKIVLEMMSWEQAVVHIRNQSEYKELVRDAYLDRDLGLNLERFRKSEEFDETLSILRKMRKEPPVQMLDVGAGNGISAIAFALEGFHVTSAELPLG